MKIIKYVFMLLSTFVLLSCSNLNTSNKLVDVTDEECEILDNMASNISIKNIYMPGEEPLYKGVTFLTTLGLENVALKNGILPTDITTYKAEIKACEYYAAYYPKTLENKVSEISTALIQNAADGIYGDVTIGDKYVDGKHILALYNLGENESIIWKKTDDFNKIVSTLDNNILAYVCQKITITANYDVLNKKEVNISSNIYHRVRCVINDNIVEDDDRFNNEYFNFINDSTDVLISFSESGGFYSLTDNNLPSLNSNILSWYLRCSEIYNGNLYIKIGEKNISSNTINYYDNTYDSLKDYEHEIYYHNTIVYCVINLETLF